MAGDGSGATGERRRKGARRIAEIPPDVLRKLNAGRLETVTLVEWLAIDAAELARSIADEVGLGDVREELEGSAARLAADGVTRRLRGMGHVLFRTLAGRSDREDVFERLASHRSDMVRAWAAFMLTADPELDLAERLEATRRFAADRSMAVRECAWDSFRPYVVAELDRAIELLRGWVADRDHGIRRCAVEGTRPRGVWTQHVEALKQEPGRGLVLLEPVRSDPSRYVQRAVANWLNDASKSRPDWTREVCERWLRESPTDETRWIVNHALRTLGKKSPA